MIQGNRGEIKITEKDLDVLYLYLDMNIHSMTEEDKNFWRDLLKAIDQEYDDKSDRSDDVQ